MSVIALTFVFLVFYERLHEIGHWFAAKITACFLGVKLLKGDPKINKGFTSSAVYDELVITKRYAFIRVNALSGTVFPCLTYFCVSVPLWRLIQNTIIKKTAGFLIAAALVIMALSFFAGRGKHSDYSIFINPEKLSESGDEP